MLQVNLQLTEQFIIEMELINQVISKLKEPIKFWSNENWQTPFRIDLHIFKPNLIPRNKHINFCINFRTNKIIYWVKLILYVQRCAALWQMLSTFIYKWAREEKQRWSGKIILAKKEKKTKVNKRLAHKIQSNITCNKHNVICF